MLPPAENDVSRLAPKPAPPVTQPRLGIVHLLGWVFFSSLVLAIQRASGSSHAEWPENLRAAMFVANIMQAIIGGAALGGFALWLWRLYRGGPRFPDQPGHYVLWVGSVSTAAAMLTSLMMRLVPDTSFTLFMLLSSLHSAAMTSVALAPLLAVPARRWRVFWMAVATTGGVRVTSQLFAAWQFGTGRSVMFSVAALETLNLVLGGAVFLALIGAVVLEIRAKGNMDWLSWAGVSLWLAGGLSAIVLSVLFKLLQ